MNETRADNDHPHREPPRQGFLGPVRMIGMLIGTVGGFVLALLIMLIRFVLSVSMESIGEVAAPLGVIGTIILVCALIGFCMGPDFIFGLRGIRTIGNLLYPSASYLLKMLNHRGEGMRIYAARELGDLGLQAKDALPKLTELSENDPNAEVRTAAGHAVTQIENALRAEKNSPQSNQ